MPNQSFIQTRSFSATYQIFVSCILEIMCSKSSVQLYSATIHREHFTSMSNHCITSIQTLKNVNSRFFERC